MTAQNARVSTPPRKGFEVGRAAQRSALSNGARLLAGLDGRSAPARRFRDLQAAIAGDLGGADNCTELQIQLIRSAAGLVVLREVLDTRSLSGEAIDARRYCRLVNSFGRIASLLGLDRQPREINSHADDARFQHVWPQFRAQEAASSASTLDKITKLIGSLDDEPPSDEPPAQENSQS